MKDITNNLIEVKKDVWVKKNAVVAVTLCPAISISATYAVEVDFIGGQHHTYFFNTKKDAEKCVEKLK